MNVTVTPVSSNLPLDPSKVVVLDIWSSYKTPFQNDHKMYLVVLVWFQVFIPTVNVL